MHSIPDGFVALNARQGFVRLCGDVYLHTERPVVAMRVTADHLNSGNIAHGGLLATLADTAFGLVLKRAIGGTGLPGTTINLSVDYIGAVREGEWLEAHVEVLKLGGRVSNATCMVKVGERTVLRASGVFSMAPPRAS